MAQVRHGVVVNPPSRAHIYLAEDAAACLEAGKFFPAGEGGLNDPYASDDARNVQPPPDGRIASAGKDFAVKLDAPDSVQHWEKHRVAAGQALKVTWSYHAEHKTRRWNYFLTKDGWNPSAPLTRAQFDRSPFATFQHEGRPYWQADLVPSNPTTHNLALPGNRRGYHVLLAVWEVADTSNAFYQVIDLSIA